MVARKPGGLERAVRRDIRAAGASAQDAIPALAIALAKRMDEGPGARDYAGLAAQFRATLEDMRRTVKPKTEDDPLAKLRGRPPLRLAPAPGTESSTG